MIFCTKWFKRKNNVEEERFEEIKERQEPFLRDLIKEEAKKEQETDPIKVRTDEALEKLISKIHEKHFSPEIQKALREMQGPLYSYVTMRIRGKNGITHYSDATIKIDDITFHYTYNRNYSLYNYKEEFVNKYLLEKLASYEEVKDDVDPNNLYKKVSEKLFIEYLYDYFFDGRLEKDIEELTKENREYEARKKQERIEAADELCAKLKDLNIS